MPIITEKETEQLRITARNTWFAETRAFVERAADARLRMIFNFIENSSILADVQGANLKVLEYQRARLRFFLIPSIPSDIKNKAFWGKYANNATVAASFNPDLKNNSTMVLRSHIPMGPVVRAILLLHEGFHAYTWLNERYNWTVPEMFYAKETETYEFQNDSMLHWGDNEYYGLLQDSAQYIRNILSRKGLRVGTAYMPELNPDSRWDTVFGKPRSLLEADVRRSTVHIHAHFLLIEREIVGAGNQLTMKRDFIAALMKGSRGKR